MVNLLNLFKFKNKYINNSKIVINNKELKNDILSWNNFLNLDNFYDVLINLGISKNEIVYLYKDYMNKDRFIYSYEKDKIDIDKWIFYDLKNKEITINDRNGYKNYKIKYLDSNNYELKLYSKKRLIDDSVTCFHKYGFDNSLFVIDNGDYELTLEILLNMDNGCLLSEIEEINSLELEEYLVNLEFPIVIEELYKDISKILKLDESMFKIFDLVITKNMDRKKVDIVMDQILICGGNLQRIIKSYEYGIITLNNDGSFIYDQFDKDSVFKLRYNNNSKYRYRFSDDSDNYRDFDMLDLILVKDDANIYVEDTKKLVRDIFNM